VSAIKCGFLVVGWLSTTIRCGRLRFAAAWADRPWPPSEFQALDALHSEADRARKGGASCRWLKSVAGVVTPVAD
jgi:hypothetical protein